MQIFKKIISVTVAAAMLLTSAVPGASASAVLPPQEVLPVSDPFFNGNILPNPGAEEEIGPNWNDTQGVTRITTSPFGGALPEGNAALQFSPGADFDFTFQTMPNVHEGDTVTFSAFARTNFADDGAPGPADLGGHIKIEFRRNNGDGSSTLISETLSSFITAVNAGAAFTQFSVQAVAPAGTEFVVFTIVAVNDDAGDAGTEFIVFDKMAASINPTQFNVQLTKNRAKAGEVVPARVTFTNKSSGTFSNARLHVTIPDGMNVNLSEVRSNNLQARAEQGSVIVPLGTITPGEGFNLVLPIVVTGGVMTGHVYDIDFVLSDTAGMKQEVTAHLLIEEDPMFDQSTVIGKVFHDRNRDGMQQDGEEGMSYVNLYTEQGVMVTTDANGMYHIPNMSPGRHVLKIDAHTLPEGTEFITEESYLFKSTPGVMNKVNFAVAPRGREDWEGGTPNLPKSFSGDLAVQITQGLDTTPPQLDVFMEPDVVKLGAGRLERSPVFTFDINYPHLVKKWWLEVRDELGRKVWSGYGIGKPPADVLWEGLTDAGVLIQPGLYSYQFKVEDDRGRQDWTLLKFFRVFSMTGKTAKAEDWEGAVKEETVYQANAKADENYREEIPPVGNFNIFQDGKRSIPLVAKPTVHVRGQTKPGYKAYVNDAPVDVDEATGRFHKEFYVKPGDNEFVINVVSPEGESTLYTEKVKVKDSMFFLVGLGEQELGTNFAKGNVDAAGMDDQYKDGFYQDGRLSYFLKGKLKGKFLVKSKYDSGDKRNALFTNLDPDQYYPIYGDNSQISYEGQNTESRFYLLVEMDRSHVRWGSFKTEFNDTELASYNRTLSGAQVHYESLQTTPYGDPKRGFKVFYSDSKHKAAHIELESTGGTLYYLRDRNVVEGSEKLTVEVRDKLQDMPLGRYELQEGVDYEIDYESGRIMLSRPLSSLAAPNTLFSTDLADGNRVFLIADYEYQNEFDPYENSNRGSRGYVHIGDHVRVGGTMVTEKRQNVDYDLRGVDMTIKLGRNTRITSEYATTRNEQVDQVVSYDGGLSFTDMGNLVGRKNDGRERAYSIKGETKPLKNWEVSGFLQGIEPGFSNDIMRSQEGYKKYGLASRFRMSDNLHLKYRYDHSEVVDSLMPLLQTEVLAPYESFNAHTAGVTYDNGKILAETEYLHRTINLPDQQQFIAPSLESEIPFDNGVVGKLGYHVNDKLLPYVKAQTTIHSKGDHQIGGGVRYEVMNDLHAYMEQMFGKLGDSTLFGIEKHHSKNASTYANLKTLDRGIGSKTMTTAIGSNYFMDNGSRLYSERQLTTYNAQDGFADIYGYDGKLGDHWDYGARYERRHMQASTTRGLALMAADSLARSNTYNTVGGHLAYIGDAFKSEGWESTGVKYTFRDRVKSRVSGEFRRDQNDPKLWQVVTRDSVEYRVTRDLSFLSYLNAAVSHVNPDIFNADFTEWNTGFAYRPVNFDRFNMLMRYTFVQNNLEYLQLEGSLEDYAHIIQMDAAFDINKYFQIVEKVGYKRSMAAFFSQDVVLNTLLWANRLNFHVTRKWDLAAEYRILMQDNAADTSKHGALVELDRELYEYVRLGVGYDFAHFTDDLRKENDYQSHGPFVRMTGKF